MSRKNDDTIDKARLDAGLPKLNRKTRYCLKCGVKFESGGNWNRLDKKCADENETRSYSANLYGELSVH